MTKQPNSKIDPELLSFLAEHQISYEVYQHPEVSTAAEALDLTDYLKTNLDYRATKNLFLKDSKTKKLYLVIIPLEKKIDLKALAQQLGLKRFSFASPERLLEVLGVTPGSVSILALINDTEHETTVVIDSEVADAPAFTAHPLRNDHSAILPQSEWQKVCNTLGFDYQSLKLI